MSAHSDLSPLADTTPAPGGVIRHDNNAIMTSFCNTWLHDFCVNLAVRGDERNAPLDTTDAHIRAIIDRDSKFVADWPRHSSGGRITGRGASIGVCNGTTAYPLDTAGRPAAQATPLTLLLAHAATVTAALMLVTALAIGWGMAAVLDDTPAYVRVVR